MSTPRLQERRATFDDLPQLTPLWRLEHLPTEDLEGRFTEFQVVVDEAGTVFGTVGVRISGHHGVLHSEAIAHPEMGDALRQMLWDRVLMVARNHSLDRIWTRQGAPFWRRLGFRDATPEELEGLPEAFGPRDKGWDLHFLRSAAGSADAIEKQFAMLRALHAEEAQRMQRHVSTAKKVALVLTVLVAFLVIAWAVTLFRYGPHFLNR